VYSLRVCDVYTYPVKTIYTSLCKCNWYFFILPLWKCKKIIYHARQGMCTFAIMVHCTTTFGRTVKTFQSGLGKWLGDRKDYWPWGVRWAWETVRQPSWIWDFLLEAQIPSMGGATILYLCCVLLWPASMLRHIIGHCGEEFGDWRFWLQKVQRTFEKEGWGGDWRSLKLTCLFADEEWRLWRPSEENWSVANWSCNVAECYNFGCLQSAESW
jgi:hypothetical protein